MENSNFRLNWNSEDLYSYLNEASSISSMIPKSSSYQEATDALKYILTNEEIKDMMQNREERKSYAFCIFVLICIYLFLVFVILFFSGFKLWCFKLSDSILLTLLGTTLINVLGVFIIVVNYLFPNVRKK